jgi:integrase/recombinase XerD
LTDLKDFGEIVTFGDLTKANIAKFDDYLHNKGLMQTSIYGRHKLLKNYINEAIRYEYIENSPYEGMRIEHGRTEGIKYLLKSEIDKIEKCKIQDTSISNARDVFIFQCYTGLSYSDLSKFKWDKVKKEGSDYIIRDVRKKTSEEYFIVLLKPAIRILIKHDFKLPLLSNQKYNEYLKLVAKYAKIDKCITSHYSRHSFAVMMLSMGVSMTNLSKMMGHSSTRITESTYAKVLATDLKRDYDMINQKLK